ncbi:target of Myb protein 1 [Episyrphus balteatus]|uniref:target of Myb protein 1 n=1 Tax=Episyrphus balteatus TaxID=286459 RepID=UPI0024861D4B|nr:target of Myb protein 1 [Episyrphus balteatus]
MLIPEDQQKYKILVEKLYRKCQDTQTENERLVLRITNTKKILKNRIRDVEILKKRLDRYNDNWRHVPMVVPHRTRKTELKRGPKPKPKVPGETPTRGRGPGKQKKAKLKQQQQQQQQQEQQQQQTPSTPAENTSPIKTTE